MWPTFLDQKHFVIAFSDPCYPKNWNYALKLKIDTPKINWGIKYFIRSLSWKFELNQARNRFFKIKRSFGKKTECTVVLSLPVYPRKWAPAKTRTCPYYASVFWYGGKILQSNAAAKMLTNREFGHPTHCILHTQYILHSVVKTSCWVLTADLTDSEGFAHFQIRICLGTKPVSCSLVFFILFSLRIFAFPKKCTPFRRLESQFMLIAHRWRWCQLQISCKYRRFIRVLSCIALSLQFLASQQNEKIEQKLRLPADHDKRRTSDQTVLGSNPAVAAALSPWTRLFTPIVPRRSLHISFY